MSFNAVITEKDGKQFTAYVAEPRDGSKRGPGLILMHEVYGVNDNLEEIANAFAEQGFCVVVPNMYWESDDRASFDYKKEGEEMTPDLTRQRNAARDLMFSFTQPTDGNLTPQNETLVGYINMLADYLRVHPACDGSVGCSGFCFGGRNTYLALAAGAHIDAGVSFYATPTMADVFSAEAAQKVDKPYMFIVGGEDPYITDKEKDLMMSSSAKTISYMAGRKAPVVEINAAGNPNLMTLYYANNGHGWNRTDSPTYDAGTSQHTLSAAIKFLKTALRRGEAIVPDVAMTTPKSETYHPKPKV